MSKRGASIDELIEQRRRERDVAGERYVPLRIDFELDGERLLTAGGRWDRRLEDFDGQAAERVVVRLHEGQRRAVEWFHAWIDAHIDRRSAPPAFTAAELDELELDVDPAHAYSALFAGGRRAGKTWIAVALAVAYSIMFPGAIVWLVSPSDQKHDEVKRYIGGVVASMWLDNETAEGWELCNGSRLLLKSAYTEEGLKEGQADLVVMNEGQLMKARAFTVARGAVVDKSGLVLVCANPPVEKKDQTWVSDFAADAAAGRRAAVFVEFNPLLNPHIDRRALLAMRAELDERTFAIEVLGQFRGPVDAVAYNWIRLENERSIRRAGEGGAAIDVALLRLDGKELELADVTSSFLQGINEGEGVRQVVGLDVQRFPYIGGPIYRFFGHPTRDQVYAWIVGEIVLEGGDELDWCEELRAAGYLPNDTLIVCDASGRYQHSRRRSVDSPPPEWKGRGSFDIIRSAGYMRIVPPDRRMKKNPEIVDRVRAFTSLICSGVGARRLFADPILAPKTCAAIRDWRTVNGKPSRAQEVAHLGDGASYPIVRLFPRRLRSGKPGGVDPVAKAVDKAPAVPVEAAEIRIMPPTRGPSPRRRGDRYRGM